MIRCPKCKKIQFLFIKGEFNVIKPQKFDDIDIYCEDCGLIGTADIEIKMNELKE